jgi:hypothetical protein
MIRRQTRRKGQVKKRAMFRMRTTTVELFRDYCRDRGLPFGDTLEGLIMGLIVLDKTRTTYQALGRLISSDGISSKSGMAGPTSGSASDQPVKES